MTPVLVDTSVWRRYFTAVEGVRGLGELLDEDDAVLVHPFVIGELILGGLADREEELLGRLPTAALVPHEETIEFVRRRRLTRRGIGWVDAHLLASAVVSSAVLWSADERLAAAARDLSVGFEGV